jgi:multidrug efflux pump subunit AcrA (membrane-fusion protein)
VKPEELDRIRAVLGHGQLRPGLPVDAMLSVRKRTALQYLLDPLTGTFRHALHEE